MIELKLRSYVRYRCILKNILNISINRVSFDNFLVLRHPVPSRRKTWTPSLNCMTRWGCKTVNNDSKMLWSVESLSKLRNWQRWRHFCSVWSGDAAKLPTLAPSLFGMIRWCQCWQFRSMLRNCQHWRHRIVRWCGVSRTHGVSIFIDYCTAPAIQRKVEGKERDTRLINGTRSTAV